MTTLCLAHFDLDLKHLHGLNGACQATYFLSLAKGNWKGEDTFGLFFLVSRRSEMMHNCNEL